MNLAQVARVAWLVTRTPRCANAWQMCRNPNLTMKMWKVTSHQVINCNYEGDAGRLRLAE